MPYKADDTGSDVGCVNSWLRLGPLTALSSLNASRTTKTVKVSQRHILKAFGAIRERQRVNDETLGGSIANFMKVEYYTATVA